MQKKYKKLFTDAGLFAISNFSSKILIFLLVPIYTNVFTPKEYGSIDVLLTTISLLYPILTLSVFDATLRFGLDNKYDKKAVFATSVIMTVIAIFLILIVSPFFIGINNLFGKYWWYFVGTFIVTTVQLCLSNYLRGCNQVKIFAIQGVVSTGVLVILNLVFLVFVKLGLRGYFISLITSHMVSILYMIFASKCYRDMIPFSFDKLVCKDMLVYSIPMVFTAISWWIYTSADKYMILELIGVSANGLYAVAHKIPSIFTSCSSIFSMAWRISAISSFEDVDNQAYYSKVYNMYSLTCLYSCIGLVFISQLIAKILFQTEYYKAWILVPPLIVSAMFAAYVGFLESILAAAKRTKIMSLSTSFGTTINIVMNYVFIQFLGIIGAPIATMLSFFVVYIIDLMAIKSFKLINNNVLRSVISAIIVIISSLYYAFQGTNKYIIMLIAAIVIILANLKDTKELMISLKYAIKSVYRRYGGI